MNINSISPSNPEESDGGTRLLYNFNESKLRNNIGVIMLINFQEKVNFIWSIAELLRGPYKKEQYGDVILPMAVLRRFDCVLASTKQEVLEKYEVLKKSGLQNMDPVLNRISKQGFNNTSNYDFDRLLAEPDNIASNLRNYINGI